jgi:hypothetical protein
VAQKRSINTIGDAAYFSIELIRGDMRGGDGGVRQELATGAKGMAKPTTKLSATGPSDIVLRIATGIEHALSAFSCKPCSRWPFVDSSCTIARAVPTRSPTAGVRHPQQSLKTLD